jgi:ABC-type arginine transport system ATPase subunit
LSPIKVHIDHIMTFLRIATIFCGPPPALQRPFSAALAMASAAFALFCGTAYAQAPIRERSDSVSTIDAARRSADAAHNATIGAQSRLTEAEARMRRASEAAAAARKEDEAARAELAAATDALARAKSGETQAQAALTRALEQRK